MLSQVSSLRLLSGHSGLVLNLSNAACAFLFSPCLLVVDASVWATSLLGVAIRPEICGGYLFIYFSSRLCCPLEIPKLPTDPPVRGFPGVWKLLPFLGWISVPNSFVSLFIFYILSYLLLKPMGCLPECLMSSASVQKLFCGICLAFK